MIRRPEGLQDVDILTEKYAGLNPYQFANNNPALFNDPTGALSDQAAAKQYKGGVEGFSNYINRNFKYDKSEIESRTALFFTFIVEPDGSVTNVSLRYAAHGVTNVIIEKAFDHN